MAYDAGATPGFLQRPQRVQLAGRLDDPREHQVAEDLVPAGGPPEPQHVIAAGQGIQQVTHLRGRDRQRPAFATAETRAKAKDALPGGQALPRDGLQEFQFAIVMRRPHVLDVSRFPPRGVHDLHRRRARGRLHRPHIRHPATLRPPD